MLFVRELVRRLIRCRVSELLRERLLKGEDVRLMECMGINVSEVLISELVSNILRECENRVECRSIIDSMSKSTYEYLDKLASLSLSLKDEIDKIMERIKENVLCLF